MRRHAGPKHEECGEGEAPSSCAPSGSFRCWPCPDGCGRRGRFLENASEVVSPLGLFAEMFDPRTGAQLGNFPQAFSHIGFINAVLYLFYAEGREIPVPDPIGSKEHRNMLGKRHVEGVDHRSRMVKM